MSPISDVYVGESATSTLLTTAVCIYVKSKVLLMIHQDYKMNAQNGCVSDSFMTLIVTTLCMPMFDTHRVNGELLLSRIKCRTQYTVDNIAKSFNFYKQLIG